MTQRQGGLGPRPGRKRYKAKPGAKDVERTKELDAKRAAAAMVDMCFGSPEPILPPEPVTEPAGQKPPKRRRGIDEKRRRCAIHEIFVNLGEPDESEWKHRGGTVSEIRRALRLPVGADRCIYQVLETTTLASFAWGIPSRFGAPCTAAGRAFALVASRKIFAAGRARSSILWLRTAPSCPISTGGVAGAP